MLSITDKDDGAFSGSNCRESTTSLRVSVHLGDDDRSDVDCLPEGFSLSVALLTNGTIHNKDDVIWFHSLLYLFHLIEKVSLLFVPTRSINDDDLHPFLFKLSNTFFSDSHWISLDVTTVERDPNLGCVLLKLVKSTCSEGISTDHGHSPPLLLVVVGNLAASSGFAATLKTHKHDDIDLPPLRLEGLFIDFKKACEFLDDCGLDEYSEVASLILLMLEFFGNVLP